MFNVGAKKNSRLIVSKHIITCNLSHVKGRHDAAFKELSVYLTRY